MVQDDISINLLVVWHDILNHHKRVAPYGHISSYAEVAQNSILGLPVFLIYVNDLSSAISAYNNFYADNTSILLVDDDKEKPANYMINHLEIVSKKAN